MLGCRNRSRPFIPQATGRCSPLPAACRGGTGSLAFSLPHARVPFPCSPRDPASGEGVSDPAPHRPRALACPGGARRPWHLGWGGAHMATRGPHVRRPAGKGVRVQSGWRVDQVAAEASWVQMCWACWEGTCATWASDGPRASLGRTCLVGFPIQPSSISFLAFFHTARVGLSQTVDVVCVWGGGMEWGKGRWVGEGQLWRRYPEDGEPHAWRAALMWGVSQHLHLLESRNDRGGGGCSPQP